MELNYYDQLLIKKLKEDVYTTLQNTNEFKGKEDILNEVINEYFKNNVIEFKFRNSKDANVIETEHLTKYLEPYTNK